MEFHKRTWVCLDMGKCPSCGNKTWLSKTLHCAVCGKEGCSKCFSFLFEIIDKYTVLDKWYSCSDNCTKTLVKEIESNIVPSDIPADKWDQIPPIHFLIERTILNTNNTKRPLQSQVVRTIKKGTQPHVFFTDGYISPEFSAKIGNKEDKVTVPDNPIWNELFRHTSMLKAKHFEVLREYENAAKVYKSLGMYEEAGRARDKRDEIRVKKTEVSINLSSLLEQVKNGGIVAVYRCPHCGGKLKIGKNTTVDTLRVCEHCGSEIETMDIADFLKTVLS